jgi:hypothetical protein
MASENKSREEWLADEQARLKQGFAFVPPPAAVPAAPSGAGGAGDQALAALGIGAGVIGGALGPHPNPVSFEGVEAAVLADALHAELADADTCVQVNRSGAALVVTVLQCPNGGQGRFQPALALTLLEAGDTLTVTMSELSKGASGSAIGEIGGTLLQHGWGMLAGRRRGLGGLVNTVGHVIQGAGQVAETLDDLRLPQRSWAVIDRVGAAAEASYLEAKRRSDAGRRKRAAALHSWTHCDYCGRAYEAEEATISNCPACGGPRAARPAAG